MHAEHESIDSNSTNAFCGFFWMELEAIVPTKGFFGMIILYVLEINLTNFKVVVKVPLAVNQKLDSKQNKKFTGMVLQFFFSFNLT